MVAFFRIILIIVVVYYLIRFLDRLIVPYLFGSPPKKQKTRNKRHYEGEYVDYEEID